MATVRELVCVALVCLCACDRGPERGSECSAVASAIVKALDVHDPHGDPKVITAELAKRCTDDRWSVEARNCFAAAKTNDDLHDCGYQHLTQLQQVTLDQVTRKLTSMPFEHEMKAMREFKDKLCACKDTACVQRVSDEMTKWSQEMAKDAKEPLPMSDEQAREAGQLGEDMAKCMQTAMAPGSDATR